MDKLALCRVCLSENFDYLIENTKLQNVYERLTATQLQTNDRRPRSVCYLCYAELVKTHKFMTKCLNADNMLRQMLTQFPNIDEKVILQRTLNKWSPISSHLSVTPIEQNDIDSDTEDSIVKQEMKLEPEDETEDIQAHEDANETAATLLSQIKCEFEDPKDDTQITENINTDVQESSCFGYDVPIYYGDNTADETTGDVGEKYSVPVITKTYKNTKKLQRTNTAPRLTFDYAKSDFDIANKPNICHYIQKTYSVKQPLVVKYSDHVPDEIQKYTCVLCNKTFGSKHMLTLHMKVHKGERPYKCEICNKRFLQKRYLNAHNKIHSNDKPYKCAVCNKEFTEKYFLNQHEITHTGVKPFECEICHKRFFMRSYLKTHYHTHTGEKPYKCDICHKAFHIKIQLKIHYRIHTGEKPFTCDICHTSFVQKSNMIKHYKTHSDDKPYTCDICHTNHRNKDNLTKHIKRHAREKCDRNVMLPDKLYFMAD